MYRSILRFHAGKIRNRNNLKRAARKCGIIGPLVMSLSEVRARLKVCKKKCNYYRKHGQRFWSKHLKNRLEKAQERGDEVAEKRILAIILGEKQRRHWRKLNYGMGKSFGRSARIVGELCPKGGSTILPT